jgi:hypothetical protein
MLSTTNLGEFHHRALKIIEKKCTGNPLSLTERTTALLAIHNVIRSELEAEFLSSV